MRKLVWVARDPISAKSIRIFKSKTAAMASGQIIRLAEYSASVTAIRHQVFLRSKGDCEFCGALITEQTMHMHEKQHRGKGGEISLSNSVPICATCHRRAHADRNTRFSKKPLTTE